VATYRLCFGDAFGRICSGIALQCRDDEHALELIEQYDDGREMEVWQDDRLVWRFAASLDRSTL
jgi:hypothetical protein